MRARTPKCPDCGRGHTWFLPERSVWHCLDCEHEFAESDSHGERQKAPSALCPKCLSPVGSGGCLDCRTLWGSTLLGLHALTLWQPWAWAITHAGKRVENRTWHPPRRFVGSLIAIHAGKRYDTEAFGELRAVFKVPVPRKSEIVLGAIVALARLVGSEDKDGLFVTADDPWFCGPVGWRLSEVSPFEPVPCLGAQGLWRVGAETLEQVRERWRTAVIVKSPAAPETPKRCPDCGSHRIKYEPEHSVCRCRDCQHTFWGADAGQATLPRRPEGRPE